jgi:hypothetical protein
MSNLTSRAQRSIRKAKWLRSTELPVWWPLLQAVLAGVFVVWFIVSIGSSPAAPAPSTPLDLPGNFTPSTQPQDSTPPTATTPTGSTPSTVPQGTELVVLPWVNPDGSVSGNTISVPVAALERARITASASLPGLAITEEAVKSYEERDYVVFVFSAQLTGDTTTVEITVVFRNDTWVTAR